MKRLLLILTFGIALMLLPEQVAAQSPQEIAEGARVWADNCTRCHNARSPLERTDRQWLTIVAHMRARANLTRREADAVAAYLQAMNGQETTLPSHPEPAATAPAASEKAAAPRDSTDTNPDTGGS